MAYKNKILTYRMQLFAIGITVIIIPVVLLFCVWRVCIKGWKSFFLTEARNQRTEALDDPKHGYHGFIRLKNGLRLHYVSQGRVDQPLVLLLHGFPESWYAWRHQLQSLSYMYRTVALDLRGFGESDKPKGVASYSISIVAADISEAISYLGYKKCILVGHELGGMVSIATASLYANQVERLILINAPHLATYFHQIQISWQQFFRSLHVIFINIPLLAEIVIRSEDFRWLKTALVGYFIGADWGTYTMEDLEAVKYYMGCKGVLPSCLNYYRAMYRKDCINMFPTSMISIPTLIIWGTADFVFNPELATLTRDMFINNAKIDYIEGASHWLHAEVPEKVNKAILDFIGNEDSNLYFEDSYLEMYYDSLEKTEDDVLDHEDLHSSYGDFRNLREKKLDQVKNRCNFAETINGDISLQDPVSHSKNVQFC